MFTNTNRLMFNFDKHIDYIRPPLWSSGQGFWLQIEVPGSIPGATRFSE